MDSYDNRNTDCMIITTILINLFLQIGKRDHELQFEYFFLNTKLTHKMFLV